MNDQVGSTAGREPSRFRQWLIVLVGIVIGQVVLYGPSLIGQKILLPLDVLASPNIYLPQTPEVIRIQPHNSILSDLVFLFEPERRFAVAELHAGRLPMWAPYHFTGAPFVWPKFSPFLALSCAMASPIILAWVQLVAAMVAGLGAYAFVRRALNVEFWPAAIAAWCYPLTGFFVLSQGFTLVMSVYWLPWLLLAVDQIVRRKSWWAPVGMSLVTGLTITSGQLDVVGQVLLVSGLYALWCWWDEYRPQWFGPRGRRVLAKLVLGWGIGFLLAAPYLLPALDYARNGVRPGQRSAGAEERPPVGIAALPQIVLPRMYGTSEYGTLPIYPDKQYNLQESSAATYTGLVATLLVAPLAFASARHRRLTFFWVGLGVLGVSWCLNIPGVMTVLRLPGFNMMSYNRLTFATSFAILALVAIGLDALWRGEIRWRWWSWLPMILLAGLCAWCGYRAINLPEPIRTELAAGVAQGQQAKWVRTMQDVQRVQAWFSRSFAMAAFLAGLGVIGCLALGIVKTKSRALVPWIGLVLVGDLIWFAFGRYTQSDPKLYYPRIPALEQLAKAPAGRMVGYSCLPALLPTTHGLSDVRGYDPIVPRRIYELTAIGSDPRSTVFAYGPMQWLTPLAQPAPGGGIQLPPVFDMLNVRYVVFRGTPAPGDQPFIESEDYWVLENRSALPRVFVPRRVETVTDDKARLEKLASPDFDPRQVAYVESSVNLPSVCEGTASILSETPTDVRVSAQMKTAGLMVLADLWDQGWRAYVNGKEATIERANHAIRGVVLGAGESKVEFRYEPASFRAGVLLAGLGMMLLLGWSMWLRKKDQAMQSTGE